MPPLQSYSRRLRLHLSTKKCHAFQTLKPDMNEGGGPFFLSNPPPRLVGGEALHGFSPIVGSALHSASLICPVSLLLRKALPDLPFIIE